MAAVDEWADMESSKAWSKPFTKAEAVTKHDTNDFTNVSRAVWVGGAGDVAFVLQDDTVATFTAVPAGSLIHIRAKRINSTGTDATNMVALS